jgi:UDP-N-acetylmuramate dehydrogenase
VQQYFNEQGIKDVTPALLRKAVISIRQSKLPDPLVVANNGSFFANPLIDAALATQLISDYPEMPHWATSDGRTKIAAAWLVEQAGFKDFHDAETGMGTWPKQALVFVNEHANTTTDLLKFKQKVVGAVHTKFGITLEQEPELLP